MTIDPDKRAELRLVLANSHDYARHLQTQLREAVTLSIQGGTGIEWQMLSQMAADHDKLTVQLDLASRSE